MDAYLGEIRIFGGSYAPQGWVFCNGQLLDISGNEPLYSLLGTTYGGDGRTNFAVPNLKGRLTIGAGHGTGLTDYAVAATVGSYTATVVEATMPSHSHVFNATSNSATSITPTNALYGTTASGTVAYVTKGTTGATTKNMNLGMLSQAGGSQKHQNVMPCMGLNYIICTVGQYPEFN